MFTANITVNRSMFIFAGYMFDGLQYSLTVWTSQGA